MGNGTSFPNYLFGREIVFSYNHQHSQTYFRMINDDEIYVMWRPRDSQAKLSACLCAVQKVKGSNGILLA